MFRFVTLFVVMITNAFAQGGLTKPLWCQATLESAASSDRPEDIDFRKLKNFLNYYPAESLPVFDTRSLKLLRRIKRHQIEGENTAEARVYKNDRGERFYVKVAWSKEAAIDEAKRYIIINKFNVGLRFAGVTKEEGDRWGVATTYVKGGVNTKTPWAGGLKVLHQSALDDIARDAAVLEKLRLDGFDLQFLITDRGRHAVLIDPERFSVMSRGSSSTVAHELIESLRDWFPTIKK